MNTVEATSLLAACKPLCNKLAVGNGSAVDVKWELEKEDLSSLWGYYKVVKAGYTSNEQVRNAAGLERKDIGLLNFVLACQR